MKSHILVVTQYFHPENFRINDICRELLERGHKVTVLTGKPNYPEGKFFEGYGFFGRSRENWNGIDIIRVPIIPRGTSSVQLIMNYYSFVWSGVIRSLFLKLKPDYVFSFEVSPMTQVLVGKHISKRKKVPHYLYVQDLWPDNLEIVGGITNPRILKHYAKMSEKLYEQSDVIFTTSPSFVETIRSRMKTGKDKVRYLPQYAEALPEKEADTGDLAPGGGFDVVFAGNIGKAQGLEILPKTADLLRNENVRFVIIGEGRAKHELMDEVRAHNAEDMFVWLGQKPSDAVPSYLARCGAAFVSFAPNSLFEKTIPAKLQTYMSCSMPIIAAAGGETERIIEDAECGVCCAVGDPEALAECIRKVKTLDLKKLGANAKKYCDENFSKEKIVGELDEYFEK